MRGKTRNVEHVNVNVENINIENVRHAEDHDRRKKTCRTNEQGKIKMTKEVRFTYKEMAAKEEIGQIKEEEDGWG